MPELDQTRDGRRPQISLFGPPTLRLRAPRCKTPTVREQIFAFLAVQEGGQADRDDLIRRFFTDNSEIRGYYRKGTPQHLRDALSALRADLLVAYDAQGRRVIERTDTRVRLSLEDFEIDAAAFLRFCAERTPGALRRARSLYQRGPLLDGWGPEGLSFPWCAETRARFGGHYLDLLRRLLMEALASPRQRREAIALLTDLAQAQPRSEEACTNLVDFLVNAGEYAAALDAVQRFRRDNPASDNMQAGAAPGARLAALERRVVASCLEDAEDTPERTARETLAYAGGVALDQNAALGPGSAEQLALYALGSLTEIAQAADAGFRDPHTEATRAAQERLRREAASARAALDASAGSAALAARGMALAERLVELWTAQGDWAGARRHLERLVALPPGLPAGLLVTEARAGVLNGLGVLAVQTQDYDDAWRLLGQALALGEQLPGDAARERVGARVHNSLAFLHHYKPEPDLPRAEGHLRRSLALFAARERDGEASRDVAWPRLGLGNLLIDLGRAGEAEEQFTACLEAGGHRRAAAYAHQALARLRGERGDEGGAYAHLAAELAIFRDLGDAGGLASSLDGFAGWADADGQWERSARLAGAAEAWRGHVGIGRWPWQQPQAEELPQRLRLRLGARACASLMAELSGMPGALEAAVAEALGAGEAGPGGTTIEDKDARTAATHARTDVYGNTPETGPGPPGGEDDE